MKIRYEGVNFLKFRDELKKINIPEVEIYLIEDTVYYDLPGKYVFIYSFHAAPTRSGFGTKAMKKIVELADKYKIILFLFPYGTSAKFYTKFGFIEASNKYKGYFEPLKLFKFYDGYEDEFDNFLENKKPLKKILNSLKKQFFSFKKKLLL